jgi:hypothetical protein
MLKYSERAQSGLGKHFKTQTHLGIFSNADDPA